jgi:hypothetical protein
MLQRQDQIMPITLEKWLRYLPINPRNELLRKALEESSMAIKLNPHTLKRM